eukprot:61045-Pelagomonas_calceolata.AAC.1
MKSYGFRTNKFAEICMLPLCQQPSRSPLFLLFPALLWNGLTDFLSQCVSIGSILNLIEFGRVSSAYVVFLSFSQANQTWQQTINTSCWAYIPRLRVGGVPGQGASFAAASAARCELGNMQVEGLTSPLGVSPREIVAIAIGHL